MNEYYEVIVSVSICGMRDKGKRRVCISIPQYSSQRVLRTRDYGVQQTVYDELNKMQNRTTFTEEGEEK